MPKIIIAIDRWKLPIFTRHLAVNGYAYENAPGLTDGTLHLCVSAANVGALQDVVLAANTEAGETGAPNERRGR